MVRFWRFDRRTYPNEPLSHPSILGKYRLIAELARGGMGVVYLGTSSGVGGFTKLHVVKELKPELVDDLGFVEMFLEEARLAARLNHPNIVPTNEVGIDGTRPFLVMEYLDGQTLARALRKKPAPFTLPMHEWRRPAGGRSEPWRYLAADPSRGGRPRSSCT